MEGWVVAATILTAVAGLVAASAAIWLAFLNKRLVEASQEQVRASQAEVKVSQAQVTASQDQVAASLEQVRLGQAQLDIQQRPILVPGGSPIFQTDHDNWLKWDENTQSLSLRNLGTGTAFNIAGVLYGCASYCGDDPSGVKRSTSSAGIHWTCWLGVPIAPSETIVAEACAFTLGNGTFAAGNMDIAGYSFNAPDEPRMGAIATQGVLWRIARLTLTYHDISGRTYASVFDYVRHRGWHMVAMPTTVGRDLHDLEGYYREVSTPVLETTSPRAAQP